MAATRKTKPTHDPCSAAVPAASCASVSLPARTPGGTPGELAGGDACATLGAEFMATTRDLDIAVQDALAKAVMPRLRCRDPIFVSAISAL